MSFDYKKNNHIWAMTVAGRSKTKIAKLLKCGRSKVYSGISDIKNNKYERKKYDSSNRNLLTSQQETNVMLYIASNKFTTLRKIVDENNLECSRSALFNYLDGLGIKIYSAKNKLILSPQQELSRFKWCIDREDWTLSDFRKVLWSDESTIDCRLKYKKKVYSLGQPSNNVSNYNTSSYNYGSYKVNIYGYISYYGSKLFKINGTFNSDEFIRLLNDEVIRTVPDQITFFQQDNLKTHFVSEAVQIIDGSNLRILDFPKYSPDLTPIENFWSELKLRVADKLAKRTVHSEDYLWSIIVEAFNEIPNAYIQNLIDSVVNRRDKIIKLCGKQLDY